MCLIGRVDTSLPIIVKIGEGDNYFVDVYKFIGEFSEEDVHPQETETDGFMLATKEEIEAFAKEGVFLHYDSIKEVF